MDETLVDEVVGGMLHSNLERQPIFYHSMCLFILKAIKNKITFKHY